MVFSTVVNLSSMYIAIILYAVFSSAMPLLLCYSILSPFLWNRHLIATVHSSGIPSFIQMCFIILYICSSTILPLCLNISAVILSIPIWSKCFWLLDRVSVVLQLFKSTISFSPLWSASCCLYNGETPYIQFFGGWVSYK